MTRVKDKVCIVTGAASGMGKADAIRLAAEGAKVVLTDLNERDGQAVAQEIGDSALFIKHNVTSEDDWKRVVDTAVSHFGGLDVLVNNAGMMTMGSVVDCTLEEYRKVNGVNSEGVFLGCKYAIPAMEATGRGGSIINMSSVAALHGMSFIAAYSASKGAVAALTKSVALY
ncbi:SDR family NAD(P)-dependent oxidoreductase, partial [Litorivivens sp.]